MKEEINPCQVKNQCYWNYLKTCDECVYWKFCLPYYLKFIPSLELLRELVTEDGRTDFGG